MSEPTFTRGCTTGLFSTVPQRRGTALGWHRKFGQACLASLYKLHRGDAACCVSTKAMAASNGCRFCLLLSCPTRWVKSRVGNADSLDDAMRPQDPHRLIQRQSLHGV